MIARVAALLCFAGACSSLTALLWYGFGFVLAGTFAGLLVGFAGIVIAIE